MTEQPDTAMAAVVCEHHWAWVSPAGTSNAARLCQICHAPDAAWLEEVAETLDAARTQRDAANDRWLDEHARWGREHARAEAAEARIATALDWFARTDCTWTYRTEMARRALTEGTGQ